MKSPVTTNVTIDLGPILEAWETDKKQQVRPEGAWTLDEFAAAASVSVRKAEDMVRVAVARGVVERLQEKGFHNRSLYRNVLQPRA